MRLAFSVAWKSIALVIAGILAAFVLVLAVVAVFGGGTGDPCTPYC